MDSRNVPDSEDWDDLVGAVKRHQCVVMLGSHGLTARHDRDAAPEPLHTALARFLHGRLDREGLNPPKRAEASTLAAEAVKHVGREQLEEWIARFYRRQEGYVDPTIEALGDLPQGIIVNTVPGLPLERFLVDRHPQLQVAAYNHSGPDTGLLEDWSGETPLVYHLYGSIEQPESLALTDRDLVDVLVSVVSGDPPLPSNLLSALRDRQRTYLFLGIQLFQWQQRVLMHVLDEAAGRPRRTSRSFAFETDEVFDGTRSFFTRGHGINFFTDMAPDEFASGLRARVNGTSDAEVPDQTPYPQRIFICHANEDKDAAASIASHLRSNGLKPWIDQDDLRGGDRWDDLIETTLENDVRYVVIVRSHNLARKRGLESYVNQEINIAMRRSRRFGRTPNALRFVIPVQIDAHESDDPELDEVQAIDYTSPDGRKALVSAIKRDIQEEMARA